MRIVNLEAFLKMSSGIVASKYESFGSFGHLFIKGESLDSDFHMTSLTDEVENTDSDDWMSKMFTAEEGQSVSMSFEEGVRDGLFEENQLYAVWDKNDVQGLINKLNESLESYGEHTNAN